MARRISRTSRKGRTVTFPYEVLIPLPWKPLSRLLNDEGLPGYWDAKAHHIAPWNLKRAMMTCEPKQVFLSDAKTAMYLKLRFE
mgnify:CR=1 FL=1